MMYAAYLRPAEVAFGMRLKAEPQSVAIPQERLDATRCDYYHHYY